jgi:aryl-alcohol dehydrogenase-like predicted oxidoreductase
MRSTLHLEENLGALNWRMDIEDIEILRRDFPGQESISSNVALS